MENIAVLGRGNSLKFYSKYSHLFKKIYIINFFKKEISKIGLSHFQKKEIIHIVGRARVGLPKEQYKKLKIKDIYLTVFDLFHFKTGKGKNLIPYYPKFINLNVAPSYMYERAFYFVGWDKIWKYIEEVDKYKGKESLIKLNEIIESKYSKEIEEKKTNKDLFVKGIKGWFSTGSYAVDLALNQNKDAKNFYMFGIDYYNTKYFSPMKLDENFTRESYGTLLQKWHIKKLVEEFSNINFYSPSKVELCESSCLKRCDQNIINKCSNSGILNFDYKNWHLI
jgi:hypothetical protein